MLLPEYQQLGIHPFPVGKLNIAAIEADLEHLRAHGKKSRGLDEDRFLILDDLNDRFSRIKGADVRLYRLLPRRGEHYPFFALVVKVQGKTVIAAEHPEKERATYVFTEFDPKFATWQEMIQLPRDVMRNELGGRQMIHHAPSGPDAHVTRIIRELEDRIRVV